MLYRSACQQNSCAKVNRDVLKECRQTDYAHTRVLQVQFLLVLCCLQCRPIKVSPEVRDKRKDSFIAMCSHCSYNKTLECVMILVVVLVHSHDNTFTCTKW